MTQSSKKQANSSKQTASKAKTGNSNNLKVVGIVVAAIVVVWGGTILIDRQHDISQQQSRFNTIKPVLQDFQTAVQQQFGSSVTVLKKTNYCDTQEQDDVDNGHTWCGMMIEGAVNELPAADSLQPSSVTMNRIDTIAHNAFTTANVSISSSIPNGVDNQSTDTAAYDDALYLSGQLMRCDITGQKPYATSGSLTPPISVGKNQVYFALSCEQRSSKKFFQYYSNY